MVGRARRVGVVAFLLGVGVACTQLFGDEQNTLAPRTGRAPSLGTPTLPAPGDEALGVCASGEMRCDGALLQTCSDDRSGWVTLQRCAAAALCQPSPAMCLAATCSADEMACSGSVLQRCNADRTGWDLFATCLSPAHCNADQRQCLTEPCSPGQRRCDRSELDQSPVLEVCNDDRLDWGPLDACVTRELCNQTLSGGLPGGGLSIGSDGVPQVQAPITPDQVLRCNLPACNVGEVRCDGARLQYCSEGRTGWITAEECASAALCSGSLGNVGSAGTPVCLAPACGVGQHQCTEAGVLQVCSEDRSGFRDLEACIGAPFCNAVLADQGQAGCRDAPCEAGQMQCNGAQIQVCRDDRTALDDVGAPCESSALCNADNPLDAFCEEPACRRGATSGSEFRCDGAQLQRCNELLTGYDTVQTCATAALCDATQRFNGCRPPVCRPGQNACNGGFLQTCNADQTGFENVENCGSQAQCDANAGRCADPCEPGSTRCNQTNGDLERCTDRLTGWQPIADCPNIALCDQPNGRCDICLNSQFSCADNQLRQCSADGGTFARQNIGPECAPLPNNAGVGVRVCQNNQVVVTPCPNGCTNGRCHECTGNQTRCAGNQIQRCNNGFFAAATSCSDGNACNGTESCNPNTNNCQGGQALNCNDNNQCTNDSCNPATGCQFAGFSSAGQCVNNGSQVQACSNGQLQTTNCTANLGCNGGRCNNCNQGACANNRQFQTCDNGQLSAPRDCPANNICQGGGNCVFNCQQLNCNDNNPCTNDGCNAQQGCTHTNNNNSCSDGNACNGNEVCQNGSCNNPPDVSCPAPAVCRTVSCNPQNGQCVTGNQAEGSNCPGGSCRGGTCVPNQVCTPNSATCASGTTRSVCNPQGTGTTTTACGNATPFCVGTTCRECRNAGDCNDGNACTTDSCNAQGACVNAAVGGCTPCTSAAQCNDGNACTTDICSAAGTCSNGTIAGCTTCDFTGSRCQANGTLGTCTGGRLTTSACADGCSTGRTACNVCTPGERACLNQLQQQTCRADGSGFDTLAVCAGNVARVCEQAGTAVSFASILCDDGNACTVDACQSNGGCSFTLPATGRLNGCECTSSAQCVNFCQNGVCRAIQ